MGSSVSASLRNWVRPIMFCVAQLFVFPMLHAETLPDLFALDTNVNREQTGQDETESIDPLTGVLTLTYADIYLPGNGGFALKVVRTYRSDRISHLEYSTDTIAEERQAGVGWTINFGRIARNPQYPICSNAASYWAYDNSVGAQVRITDVAENPVLELPDGTQQKLIFTQSGSPLMITPQRWRAECFGDGLSIYSPDGIRYDMNQRVNPISGSFKKLSNWYTTKITDRNGNFATINYVAGGSDQISTVFTNDGRSVSFTYFDPGQIAQRVATVTTGGRVWSYDYLLQAPGDGGRHFLVGVTRPDAAGTKWSYSYQTARDARFNICGSAASASLRYSRLLGATNPTGGTTSYSYSCWKSTNGQSPSLHAGVGSKSTSDGGSWTYSHALGSDFTCCGPIVAPQKAYDTTRITTPAGVVIEYRFIAPSADYTVAPVWTVGLMTNKIVSVGSTIVQSEYYSWGSQIVGLETTVVYLTSQPLSYGTYGDPVMKRQDGIFAPVRTQLAVSRDGATYQTTYSNHDAYGNPQTITESGPNGGTRTTNLTYYIDPVKWIVKQVDDETIVGVGSVLRGWDANGNLLSENRDGVTTNYTRHASGDIATMTTPRGLISNFSNYKRGTAQFESHPEGVNLSRIVSDAGNVESFTNGEARTTTFAYEPLNRLARITPPLGNPTTIVYAATTKTATRGVLQQVETVDGFGRTINVSTGGISVAAAYDSLGRKTFGSIVGFPTVGHNFQYDGLDRVTRITHNADASYRTFTYGPANLAVRDERGHVTTHTYRSYGDPDMQLLMAIAAPVTAANVSITRNGRGQVTSATQGGFTRTFGYDSRYYLTSTIHPEIGTTVYGRDNAGNMTTKQVTAGPLGASGTTIYDYDGRDRLWRVTYPNSSPSTVTNTYWRTDKLKAATNAVATRSYGYDGNQNLKTETLVVDGLTMAATYNYTTNDQLLSISYPVLNRTVSFSPDVLGRPTAVVTPAGSMLGVGFWPNGQIADVAYAGGSRVTYGQNTREWLNAVTMKTGDGISRIASTLVHDVAGNLLSVTDSADASYNRTLTHDSINRLATVSGPWGAGTLGYDGSGNISTYTLGGNARTYGYDTAKNRLANVTSVVGGASTVTSYGYDIYGNASPSATPYVYDQTSNLQTAAGRTYTYDATNKRVKTVGGAVTTYEFRSAQGLLLAEWKKQAGYYDVLKEHIHVAGKEVAEQQTNFLGASIQPVSWMFLQHDANGSVLSSTWAGGSLLFKENYQPYGSQINGTAPGYTQRAFAGHKQDASDLIYMGARYYNPQIGRFLSIDPKEADPSDLHSLNRYAYANNNPYRYVDPDGYTPLDIGFFAVDAVRLGLALYGGGDVKGAAIDLAMSAIGVVSPIPGAGQAAKALRVADKAVEGVKAADHAVDAARSERAVAKAAKPNGGVAPKHGGEMHNNAIDARVKDLGSDGVVSNIRKNQQQVDINGNRVGRNRPDLQYDKDGCHHCVEFDTVPRSSSRHGDTIRSNDSAANVELNQL